MKTYKVAVTGGRDHQITDEEEFQFLSILEEASIKADPMGVVVLHGGCRGVDQRAAEIAESAGFPTVAFEAPWEWMVSYSCPGFTGANYKKLAGTAGPLRNWMMLKAADLLVAFPGGRGTANAVRQAGELGVEVVRL